MGKLTYWILAILMVGTVVWLVSTRSGLDQALAKANPVGEPQLGGVRVVVQGEDPQKTIDVLIAAAKEVGWADANRDEPNAVTFVPPSNYTPEMFGRLLKAFEETGKHNFGLQLLDHNGRAIGPDGKPID